MTFLGTVYESLGVPTPRSVHDIPKAFAAYQLADTLRNLAEYARWTEAILEVFPTAVRVDFDWTSEYDDEGGSFTTVNWSGCSVYTADGTDLLFHGIGHELIDRLHEIECNIGTPSSEQLKEGLDIHKPPFPTWATRQAFLDALAQWASYVTALPDAMFASAKE
jgi:hypothetical protein